MPKLNYKEYTKAANIAGNVEGIGYSLSKGCTATLTGKELRKISRAFDTLFACIELEPYSDDPYC
jgi:hypothetical protein